MGGQSGRRVVAAYLVTTSLFTLSASLIWGVNTLFLLSAGLTILQVMLVNAAFTFGQMVFEVPTGVLADTIGRKASYLIGLATILVSTLLYVGSEAYGWGVWAFAGASVLLGFGFTCQTGAVEAWLVDALDAAGYAVERARVFAWGGMVTSVAMLAGTLGGGFLGQANLRLPYLARSALLAAAFLQALAMMRETGFERRPLRPSVFRTETRRVLGAGAAYGWRHPVVRPLMFASLASGLFMFYGFYSFQPYALELLGMRLVWLVGALTAAYSLASIAGSALVGPVMRSRFAGRGAARLLAASSALGALAVGGAGAVGLLARPSPGTLALASALYLVWGFAGGFSLPVRQAFLNRHIPSAQRATVLSLDALFADAGGAAGQPFFGWVSSSASIGTAWILGAFAWAAGAPLYLSAARADEREERAEGATG